MSQNVGRSSPLAPSVVRTESPVPPGRPGDAICLIAKDLHLVFANDAACRLLGYARENLDSAGCNRLMPRTVVGSRLCTILEGRDSIERLFDSGESNISVGATEIKISPFTYRGEVSALVQMRDLGARAQLDDVWRFVTEYGWSGDCHVFLSSLAEYLGRLLEVDYVVIDRVVEQPGMAETMAFYARGEMAPNLCYALKDTPCENVMGRSPCAYPQGVRALFDRDEMLVDMEVESYIGVPLLDATGGALGLIAVMHGAVLFQPEHVIDVLKLAAGRAAAELARAQSERIAEQRAREFRILVEQSPDVIIRYNRDARRVYVNPGMHCHRSGQPVLLGTRPADGSVIVEAERYQQMLETTLASGEQQSAELAYRLGDGRIGWTDVRLCPEINDRGEVESAFAVCRDITENVELRERLRTEALTDSLTGLMNRQALYQQGPVLISEMDRCNGSLAVMILDLDRFKEVNDTLGHNVGDKLLCSVARRMTRITPDTGLLVRLGGDEFALLVPDADRAALRWIAAEICRVLALPFEIDGRPAYVTASVGVAVFPTDGGNLDELLSCADASMYHAKRSGKNRYEFHRPEFTEVMRRKTELAQALRAARDGQGLELHFQPKVRLGDNRLIGAEALLRWRHPQLGQIAPTEFIAVAEETGLIVSIGRWVLTQAAETAVFWNEEQGRSLHIAVNVSVRQFLEDDLPLVIRRILERTGCRAYWLELEVTETLLLEDDERVQTALEELRQLGVKIAIDDFGTGYSALSYLARFDVHALKIDRHFIAGMDSDSRQRELVRAFIAIASSLDLELVAEGVETEEQARFLREQGCYLAQGYLFDAPLPRAQFERRWLAPR